VLGNEYAWNKKPSTEKFAKDVGRAWEHSLTYVDAILE